MDYDLEIISEEGCSRDPLFDSIISAMNSMKEATADKIYQKIQKEGATNYSKPQVDRALASALKYGIFEVKNQRYRVRDDVLDDVDTVYWRMQKNREQTPFGFQDGMNDRHLGRKLDPEKDNLRFKKMPNSDTSECPQCGRVKRPSPVNHKDEVKAKRDKKNTSKNTSSNNKNSTKIRRNRQNKKRIEKRNKDDNCDDDDEDDEAYEDKEKLAMKRKYKSNSPSDGKCVKVKKFAFQTDMLSFGDQDSGKYFGDDGIMRPKKDFIGKYDTTDESELDSMSLLSDDEQSFGSYQTKSKYKQQKQRQLCRFDSDGDDMVITGGEKETVTWKKSNETIKTFTDSDLSSISDEPSKTNLDDIDDEIATNSKASENGKDAGTSSKAAISDRDENDESTDQKSQWISEYADLSGAVIHSDNVLTIEPRDSMAFSGLEHTSYIS